MIELLYGSSYESAATALRLLAPAIALYPICYVTGYLLVSQDRQRVLTWVYGLVALENILANLVLIPWLSLNGAALGTSISQLLVAVAFVAFAQRTIGGIGWSRIAAGPVLATLLAAGTMAALRDELALAVVGRNRRLPRRARALRALRLPRGRAGGARRAPADGLSVAGAA